MKLGSDRLRVAAGLGPAPRYRLGSGPFLAALASRLSAGTGDRADRCAYALLAAVGFAIGWASAARPATLPVWAPWDFSAVAFATASLSLWWFSRGVAASGRGTRPSLLRQMSFVGGVAVIYAVTQTRFEYLAEHMFVLNRIQHVAMHHLGPMLIALAWPGEALMRGMPAPLRRLVERPALVAAVRWIQHPTTASLLFVGLIFLWLIPEVHFRAMIDRKVYWAMNWSMIIDGILFWSLVLDPRPSPPAPNGYPTRAAVALLVMFPQILGGATIAFAHRDLYPYYELCGRAFPTVGALADQCWGGLVIWIPPAMTSVVGVLLTLDRFRRWQAQEDAEAPADSSEIGLRAKRWTG